MAGKYPGIRERGPYQFQAQVRVKGYPSQTQTFRSLREAQEWQTKVEAKMLEGTFVDMRLANRTTFRELLERYEIQILPSKALSTQKNERAFLKDWLNDEYADRIITSLTHVDFCARRDEWVAEGYAGNSVRLWLALPSHVFTVAAEEWGFQDLVNPLLRVKNPVLNKRIRRLKGTEESRLLEAFCHEAANPIIMSLVILAIETAMRQSELLSLDWSNVDTTQSRTLYLPKTKNYEERTIPLSRKATETLNALGPKPTGLVFGVTQGAVIQAFDTARRRAGIDDFTFHDLRHEATSRLFERGLSSMKVQTITGHKSMQMLARYTHLDGGLLVSDLDATDILLTKPIV